MQVKDRLTARDAMSSVVLSIGPTHTLRDAARRMSERKVGAVVVMDPDHDQPGILTDRDILDAVGARTSTSSRCMLTSPATSWSRHPTGR